MTAVITLVLSPHCPYSRPVNTALKHGQRAWTVLGRHQTLSALETFVIIALYKSTFTIPFTKCFYVTGALPVAEHSHSTPALPAAERYRPLADTKRYRLVTDSDGQLTKIFFFNQN